MKTFLAALVAISLATGLAWLSASAQQSGARRTDLQKYDIGIAEREVVQVRVDFDPGFTAAKHRHPGEEVIYVLEGTLVYHVEGRLPTIYKSGDVLTIPFGAIHWVENVGSDNGAELATYIVEKGKPILEIVQ